MPDTNHSDSSHLSPAPTPTWPPPRSPLPPHRLAKLANALGVSTPIPLSHSYSLPPLTPSSQPNSSTSACFPDQPFRRSPTPSVASGATHVPSSFTSKYLLHIVPPDHLPHDYPDAQDLPPPPTTSGYHTQFKRGVMVPVYPTLHLQLGAIAKEYALPSTVGMILYLITTNPSSGEVSEEPGPRISDDVWRHIWTRVLKSEREELHTPGPKPLGLGLGISGGSSPALLQDLTPNAHSFRPVVAPRRIDTPQASSTTSYPLTPSPSTPSNSAYSSQSEVDTPESASSVDPAANVLPLPGLNSPSLIPILAKVEFDIDRRKAGWYDHWVKNRKASHAKRAESRAGARGASRMGSLSDNASALEDGEVEGTTRKAPIDLEIVERLERAKTPNFLLTTHTSGSVSDAQSDMDDRDMHVMMDELDVDVGYQQLTGSPIEGLESEIEEVEGEEIEDHETFAGLSFDNAPGSDPLTDVFGTDEETWQDIHSESSSRRTSKPRVSANIVDLALDAAAISALPENVEEEQDQEDIVTDEQEINEILHRLSRPTLAVAIPPSPPSVSKRRSSPTTSGTIRRHVPPPLNLTTPTPTTNAGLILQTQPSPMPDSAGYAHLAYLGDSKTPSDISEFIAKGVENEEHEEHQQSVEELDTVDKERSPQDEKRDGAIFDELSLGLDPSLAEEDTGEFYDLDPNDRRRSQYIMAAQLDEIEKNLAQFSPRRLNPEVLADDAPFFPSNYSPTRAIVSARSLGEFPDLQPPPKSNSPEEPPSWPAVPYSSLNHDSPRMGSLQGGDDSLPPSPPKFAFNGISTEPPKSPFQQTRARSGTLSDESMARKRALEEESGLYPPLIAPNLFGTKQSDSPIIPLSPDPFGRFPTPAEYEDQRQSQVYADDFPAPPTSYFLPSDKAPSFGAANQDRPLSHTPSSRFSVDSVTSQDAAPQQHLNVKPRGSSALISVKSLRKLWRKSGNKGSTSGTSTPTIPDSGRTSPNIALAPPTNHNPQEASPNQAQPAGRSRARSISRPSPHGSPLPDALPTHSREPVMPEFPMRPHHFDGEARFPRHPSLRPSQGPPVKPPRIPSPPLPPPPAPSPSIPPKPPSPVQRPPSLVHQRQPSISQQSTTERSLSVRKSILKSWKSATGLSSHHRSGSRPSSSSVTPRSSTEQLPETGRRRRPSVLELAHAVRGSTASVSPSLGDIPPSPALPEQYQQVHSRAGSRQSQMNGIGGAHADGREDVKGRQPSLSSTASSPPRVRSPLHNAGSPPRSTLAAGSRTSQESFESRPSFDVSQFEIVSPPKTDSFILESTLSYPYHGLDHSMTSHE